MRVHAAPQRRGILGIVQRLAIVVLPGPRLPVPLLEPPGVGAIAARERARRALMEARHAMSGVIGNSPSVPEESTAVTAVLPDLERLQAYLEESDRDRAALREEVSGLRGMLQQVSAQLDLIQRTIEATSRSDAAATPAADDEGPAEGAAPPEGAAATPAVAADGSPRANDATAAAAVEAPSTADARDVANALPTATDEAQAPPGWTPAEPRTGGAEDITVLRERVLRALRERVFAAGTVGTRVEIRPALAEPEAASVLARMNEEALVELAEEGLPAEDATSVRVTLRWPMRWEQFSALLEAALGRPLPPGSVGWSQGVVHVDAPHPPAAPAEATAE